MEPEALMRINAQEEHMLPVEIKIKMLMEQAAMRMRASAMVGQRISMLDDVIRVRSLLAIIRSAGQIQETVDEAQTNEDASTEQRQPEEPTVNDPEPTATTEQNKRTQETSPSPRVESNSDSNCSEEDIAMYTRMAVSALKTVLFQLAEEGSADGAKDLSAAYEGLVSTEALCQDASEGFPGLDVDSLLDLEHARYRKVVVSRHRYLLRKLSRILDMDEDMDTLLALAEETEAETLEDQNEMADVPLQQSSTPPKLHVRKEAYTDTADTVSLKSSLASNSMSSLRNTSWGSGKGGPDSDGTTEDETSDETDEETPQRASDVHHALVSPSH